MRPWALLVPVLLALPALSADATSPTPAYEVDVRLAGVPVVGEARELTITILARLPLEASLSLDAPPWVRVEGGDWNASIPKGGRASHTWRVEAERTGFWHASMSFPTEGATYNGPADWSAERVVLSGCCLFARSDADDGAWSQGSPRAVLPPARVTHDLSTRALDAERAELELAAAPNASWMRNASLELDLGTLGGNVTALPPGEAGTVTRVVPLAAGNSTVVTESLSVRVPFEAARADGRPAPDARVHVHCRNVHLLREGDNVREVDAWGCEAKAHAPRLVPAPAAPLLLLLAALLARPRGPRRPSHAGRC